MKEKTILIMFLLFSSSLFSQLLDTVQAREINKSDHRYQKQLTGYKKSDQWKIWSVPIGDVDSTNKEYGQNAQFLSDLNLNSAWQASKDSNSVGQKISFTININSKSCFGCPFTFYGEINLFNGYCKSLTSWKEYARVKLMKVQINENELCIIKLQDTWQLQLLDISQFFKNEYINNKSTKGVKVKNGDKITFEILEVYQGAKYNRAMLTEFVAKGAAN